MARFGDQLPVAVPCLDVGTLFVAVVPGAHAAGQRAVGVVEAEKVRPPVGLRAEVPLADQAGVVADALERHGQRDRVPGQRPLVLRAGHSEAAPEAAGHQGRAGGATDRGHVVLGKFNALAGYPVETRRRRIAAMEGHVGIAQVVGHDEDEIRLLGRPERQGGAQQKQAEEGRSHGILVRVQRGAVQHGPAPWGLDGRKCLQTRLVGSFAAGSGGPPSRSQNSPRFETSRPYPVRNRWFVTSLRSQREGFVRYPRQSRGLRSLESAKVQVPIT